MLPFSSFSLAALLPGFIPSHSIATWLLTVINRMLKPVGLQDSAVAEQAVYFVIILAVSVLLGFAIKYAVLWAVRYWVRLRDTQAGAQLLRMGTLSKCSHVIPPLVFLALVPFAFDRTSEFLHIVVRAGVIYLIATFCYGLSSALRYVFTRVDEKANTKNLPVQGAYNIALGIVWLVGVICAVSVAVGKSPGALLTGLTAFAAVLMLVFKDTILGFVAGIQMSQNDMLHVGDWIVVPGTPANGIVTYVSLSTVKVQNFDNTIITVPPYTLVSQPFQNWRGMSASGERQICAEIIIEPTSIRSLGADDVQRLGERFPQVARFAATLPQGAGFAALPGASPWNGSVETNLGLFRAYMVGMLLERKDINPSPNLMVKLSNPTPDGVPMQIYCFAATTDWLQYEGIKSQILEHAVSTATAFGLEVFSPSDLLINRGGGEGAAPASEAGKR